MISTEQIFMGEIMQNSSIRSIGLLSLFTLLAACSSGAKIVANSDPMADFGAFKTYDFYQQLSTDRGGPRTILSTHLLSATTREIEARGFRRSGNNPDLLIDFMASTQDKIQVRNQPTTGVSMHRGRGRGGAGTWSGASMTMSTQQVTQTTEGTVAVDMVDRKKNQLVWEAAAVGRVTDKTMNNMGSVVQGAVADMFAKFPVQPTQVQTPQ
jgi:hypothetical protein